MHSTLTLRRLLLIVMALVAAACIPSLRARGAVGRENFFVDGEQQFVNRAWNLNQMQILLGKNVERQAASADVKAFGERMVAYHTVFNDDLRTFARQYRGSVPSQLDRVLDRLAGLSGPDFDREYMRAMIDALTQARALFDKQSNDVAQTPLDNWAGTVVPKLQQQLQVAQRIGRDVGAPSGSDDAVTASHKEPASAGGR
jgi:putative membrane protein